MQGRKRNSRPRIADFRAGRSPARRRGSSSAGRRLRLPVHATQGPRSRKRTDRRMILKRCASEPTLWYDARVHPVPRDLSPPPPPLERPHTCYDVFALDSPVATSTAVASSLHGLEPWEEAKVVVNVTVEGSAGPVKAVVRLGSSIREAIAAVVERYDREGRSPRLDPASADSFQLHRSHFCLESLNKNDKIGDVGGRNFYLHKKDGSSVLVLQKEESGINLSSGEITQSYGGPLAGGVPYHHPFFVIVSKKVDKIGRRTKRIWRVLTCDCT